MKKLSLIFILLIFAGCQSPEKLDAKFNTEIFCPNSSYRFLILQATKAEAEKSIQDAVQYYLKSNKKNRYTVLYLPDGRNTSIYNINPIEIQKECILIERPRKLKDIK
jgi:hypothetical protein